MTGTNVIRNAPSQDTKFDQALSVSLLGALESYSGLHLDATNDSPQRRGERGGSAEAKRSSLRKLGGLCVCGEGRKVSGRIHLKTAISHPSVHRTTLTSRSDSLLLRLLQTPFDRVPVNV